MSIFKDKTLMITGGTGSFGNAVLNRFLATDIKEIRIFSRDEKKQDDMRHEYQAKYPQVAHKIKFYIGDVRNKSTLKTATRGVDYIFWERYCWSVESVVHQTFSDVDSCNASSLVDTVDVENHFVCYVTVITGIKDWIIIFQSVF